MRLFISPSAELRCAQPSLSPYYLKIFTVHLNLSFLPVQNLKESSIYDFFVVQSNARLIRPPCISINKWVKKELSTQSKSNESINTQTSSKKDQPTTPDLLLSQNKFDLNNTVLSRLKGSEFAKGKLYSKEIGAPHRYCEIHSATDPHPSIVMICSHNKLEGFSQLNLIDNKCWGFIRKQNFKIIRPLLNCSRSSITRVCNDFKIPVYPDKSNQSMQYSRNRIRKQIIPIIKLFFNPQVEDSLFKFAELITKEQNLLTALFNTY